MGGNGKGKRKQAARSQAGVSRGARRAKRTLLVLHVNDSTDDQVLFQTACKHAKVPFVWHVADSAEKALSYFRTLLEVNRRHAVRWPDLVLLDIVMPGDSGLRVLEYMRATPDLKALPVVIFTSEDEPKLIRKAAELGANSYLLKPKQFHETVQLVGALYATWSRAKRPAAAAAG
jgi:CheY-like chemotaxis protein